MFRFFGKKEDTLATPKDDNERKEKEKRDADERLQEDRVEVKQTATLLNIFRYASFVFGILADIVLLVYVNMRYGELDAKDPSARIKGSERFVILMLAGILMFFNTIACLVCRMKMLSLPFFCFVDLVGVTALAFMAGVHFWQFVS
jgi:hypothetical protein